MGTVVITKKKITRREKKCTQGEVDIVGLSVLLEEAPPRLRCDPGSRKEAADVGGPDYPLL